MSRRAKPDRLEKLIEAEESKTARQISKDYNDALKDALKKTRDFFKRARDVETGKVKPPSSLKTDAQIEGWKKGYMTRALKQQDVVGQITDRMKEAGVKTRQRLQQSMRTIYDKSRKMTFEQLNKDGRKLSDMTKRKIDALLYGPNSNRPFSKIAFDRLGSGKNVRERLRRELAEGIRKGEGQDKLLKRVMKVTGAEEKDAKRILRTESTQIESLAQMDAMEEMYELTGAKPWKRWVCTFNNSRDTHMELHGQEVPYDEPFQSSSGALLMFPGDNSAPPEEVINCRCYMEVFEHTALRDRR